MKGNAVGLITALLTAIAVLWQGYEEYKKEHPTPVTRVVQKPVAPVEPTPIYWHDGTTWRCQVGDKQYVWVNNSQTMPIQRVAANPGSMVY
jgi:hypothetical protein